MPSTVYFTREITPESLNRIFDALGGLPERKSRGEDLHR